MDYLSCVYNNRTEGKSVTDTERRGFHDLTPKRGSIPDFSFTKVVCCSIFLSFIVVTLIHEKIEFVTDDVFSCPTPGYWGTSIPDFAP